MNKLHYIIILSVLFLLSCGQPNPNKINENQDQDIKEKYPIVEFVEDFIAAHPNFDSNDITRKKADEEFIKSFTEYSDSINLILGIPVKLEALNEISDGKITAQFRSWITPYNFKFPLPIDEVNFDIVGVINPKYVNTLNEDSYYTIHGKFVSRIESINAFEVILGRQTRVYTEDFSVRKDDIYDDKYDVKLGMMYFDIDSVSVYKD